MTLSYRQILIIDDSKEDIGFLQAILSGDYSIVAATSGAGALDICASGKITPSVILLDVSMPDMDGYQTCQAIKALSGFEQVEVIFVSANDSLDEKRKGYEAGGNDYLSKPVNRDEILQKVKLAVLRKQAREDSESQSKMALDTAMTAIMDASEQSNVIHFLRQSFSCQSVEELAQSIVDTCDNFGLLNTVQIRTDWQAITKSSGNNPSPLEIEMLTSLQQIGRIYQRGQRLILNFGNISQLIKNLPDDEAKCGRLRDHLALILEGAESRLKALNAVDEMKSVMEGTNDALSEMATKQANQKRQNVKIMDEMIEEIQVGLFDYGLTEEQEKVLLGMVERYSEKVFSAYEEGLQLEDSMAVISSSLQRAIKQFFQSAER